jgi:hypothetical protein
LIQAALNSAKAGRLETVTAILVKTERALAVFKLANRGRRRIRTQKVAAKMALSVSAYYRLTWVINIVGINR